MTTGSTGIKVTLGQEIKDGKKVKDGIKYDKEKEELSEEEKEVLEKEAVVPNIQSFIELVQEQVADGNEIELIQKSPSIISKLPSYIMSLLPTFIMILKEK